MKKRDSRAQKRQLQKPQMRKNHFNIEFVNTIGQNLPLRSNVQMTGKRSFRDSAASLRRA
jgi:hypothetical protein